MAFNVPAKYQVIPQSQLFSPLMATTPLQKIVENTNFLYQYHRPALVSVAPSSFPVGRASEYHVPMSPSADGLRYDFETRHVFSAASQAFTVSVDYTATYAYGATAWTALYSTAYTSSATAGGLTTATATAIVIPASANVLRFSVTAPAAGNRRDHHFLVTPSPSGVSAGVQPSGFAPFDDGLLVSSSSAVHTEWLNRVKSNVGDVLTDRHQMCFSFVQEYGSAMHTFSGAEWSILPTVRAYFPGQKEVDLNFRAIATVSAGAGTYRMRIGTPGGSSTYLSALTGEDSQFITLPTVGTGNTAHVDLQLWCRATAGNTLAPYSVIGMWRP